MPNGAFTNFVNWLARTHPLALAVIIDILMIIPYFDIVITLYLQIVLWDTIGNEYFKWLNIAYDLMDFTHPFVDIFPLNTTCVIACIIYKKIPYNV